MSGVGAVLVVLCAACSAGTSEQMAPAASAEPRADETQAEDTNRRAGSADTEARTGRKSAGSARSGGEPAAGAPMPASRHPASAADAGAEPVGWEPSADPIGWEDLERLTFEAGGRQVQLRDGTARLSHGDGTASIFTLQNRVAQGDLDSDGDDDYVAHIVEDSADSGAYHLIVGVIDDDGTAQARPPVAVGDRVVLDEITVDTGEIRVVLFDRAPDEPFTVITRRTTLSILQAPAAPLVQVVAVEAIEDLPMPGPERRDIEVRFSPGADSALRRGRIDFRQRQTYTVQASESQTFSAEIEAPIGVWLDVRLDDDRVLLTAAERRQRVEAELPAGGQWRVSVVSAHAGAARYALRIEALPVAEGQHPNDGQETTAPRPRVRVPRPRLPGDGQGVYLTFDDGPHPVYTPQVLDLLAAHGASATFFVIGAEADKYPELIERIAAEGHTLANHTWNHEDLAGLSMEAFYSTVGRTQDLLGEHATPCLRPPYGSVDAFTQGWAAEQGLHVTTWTVDPADWSGPPAEMIADHIVQHAAPGAVILLHDGGGDRSATVEGLAAALQRLAGQNLRYDPLCLVSH